MRTFIRARTATAAAVSGLLITSVTTNVQALTPDGHHGHGPTKQEIRALFGEWNEALATGDPERVADRYAPEAVLEPTLSNLIRHDHAGIVDYFEHFLLQHPSGEINESYVELLGQDGAVDSGGYTFHLTDPETGVPYDVVARYTFVYERDKHTGEWLIVDHHSSAMPEG
ncbi:SgcJ/EcaC family oxidoreductase [Streptomyces sp. NBC_01803]|uniref:SgcJ/EcaC family oxidoreductase n=1 Tax=Streptomyces sp. NBC_01803 TaxID=2975946 RepID=UPI002DDAED12|nr:SgcJ/EcaC family oxidoreductase [Streptomyces sp. NBC_01803]WSA45208.1 SgcJ/EcaC family oxidoreductase [Streptomyces sp. NBC_01803]